jgi:hypothetical protein
MNTQGTEGIFARIFDYCTITVIGTVGTKELFPGISKPLEFRKIVQDHAVA